MGDQAFLNEVRRFLDSGLTPKLRRAGTLMTSAFADFHAAMAWHRILFEKGWVAPDWPVEYGGTGWSPEQRYLFQEECKLAGAPSLLPMGLQMLGPMLIRYGTAEQKAHYLPRILSGEDVWCQGYSEPGSGSDLASLSTAAVRDGDDYIVNGTKIWTSYAHYANRIFCLVRTSKQGPQQEGISFLLIDMDTPGITVEPIVGLDGRAEQCQVFFDDVRVPVANRVGEENQGWTVAKYLLEFERGGHSYAIEHRRQRAALRLQAAAESSADGRPWIEDVVFRHKLADVEVDALALDCTERRIKGALAAGQNPGALSSLTKVVGTEIGQRFNELSVEVMGRYVAPCQQEALAPDYRGAAVAPEHGLTAMAEYINNRASTIYGGTAEIQRDIIAKRVLGL